MYMLSPRRKYYPLTLHIFSTMWMFSPQCESVVPPRHVQKQVVCLEVLGALITTPKHHGRQLQVRWIVWQLSTSWTTPSPDLKPPWYFLWSSVKDDVYVPPAPITVNNLKDRIRTAIAKTDQHLLRKVWYDVWYIWCVQAANGAHIKLAKIMK
jgi:hypothetical protein